MHEPGRRMDVVENDGEVIAVAVCA